MVPKVRVPSSNSSHGVCKVQAPRWVGSCGCYCVGSVSRISPKASPNEMVTGPLTRKFSGFTSRAAVSFTPTLSVSSATSSLIRLTLMTMLVSPGAKSRRPPVTGTKVLACGGRNHALTEPFEAIEVDLHEVLGLPGQRDGEVEITLVLIGARRTEYDAQRHLGRLQFDGRARSAVHPHRDCTLPLAGCSSFPAGQR